MRAVSAWFNQQYDLKLTERQVADLTSYLETVGDGEEAYEDTVYYLDAEMEEFIFFLSAYEFLEEKNKPELMNMTFDTIALEIRNHKWELQDPKLRPIMERMADIMDEATAANKAGQPERVRAKVSEYRDMYEKYKDVLK